MVVDRFGDRTLAKLAESINRHLPEKRHSLKSMLEMENPSFRARDGIEYDIEKSELEFIAEHVDKEEHDRFSIPIILEMTSLGDEYVVYVRDRRHADFFRRAFGFDRYVNSIMMLYSYELQRVRKLLKTTTQIMFRV